MIKKVAMLSPNGDLNVNGEIVEIPEELRSGRNLLIGSQRITMAPNSTGAGKAILMTDEEIPYHRVTADEGRSVSMYYWYKVAQSQAFKLPDTFTISVDLRPSIEANVSIGSRDNINPFESQSSGNILAKANEWKRVVLIINYTRLEKTNNRLFSFNGAANQVDYRNWKIELGSKSTPWSPAPEDLGYDTPDWVQSGVQPFGFQEKGIITNRFSEAPNSLRFNGISSYALPTVARTISSFRFDKDYTIEGVIIAKDITRDQVILLNSFSGNNRNALTISRNHLSIGYYDGTKYVRKSSPITLDTPIRFTAICKDKSLDIYIDGVKGEGSAGGYIWTAGAVFGGYHSYSSSESSKLWLDANIMDISIYDYAKNEEEIFNNPHKSPIENERLQHWWSGYGDDFILKDLKGDIDFNILGGAKRDYANESPMQISTEGLKINGEISEYPNIIENGLVLWYDFMGQTNSTRNKGIATDLSGNGNNAPLANFAFESGSGYDSDGLQFDGVDDTIYTSALSENLSLEYTFEVCMKIPDISKLKHTEIFIGNGSWNNNLAGGVALGYNLTHNRIQFVDRNFWSTGSYLNRVNIPVGVPFLIQGVSYLGGSKLYMNGELVATTSYEKGALVINRLGLGRAVTYGGYSSYELYSVKVYNRALTPEEAAHNYEVEKGRWNL